MARQTAELVYVLNNKLVLDQTCDFYQFSKAERAFFSTLFIFKSNTKVPKETEGSFITKKLKEHHSTAAITINS